MFYYILSFFFFLAGIWDRIGFEPTFDDARTSLLSNMDSDSTSDSIYDVGDDLFPLFLHLVCSVRSQNKDFMLSNAVKVLPTCIGMYNVNKCVFYLNITLMNFLHSGFDVYPFYIFLFKNNSSVYR